MGYKNFSEYGKNFLGHYDLNSALIKDIRKLLRKTGFRLWVRGGNPDRKQHEGKLLTTSLGFTYKVTHRSLRTSLPLEFATYGRYYLREVNPSWNKKPEPSLDYCRGLAEGVIKIYKLNGVEIKKNVPLKFKTVSV